MAGVPVARIIGGNGQRKPHDFYQTPPLAVWSLLAFWKPAGWMVWEPACGGGAIVRVLEQAGYGVIATDLIDQGMGGGRDFLREREALAPTIITNPPFKDNLPERFIRHAWELGVQQVALLLKCTYWNTKTHAQLWQDLPPRWVLPLTWRLDFEGKGQPTLDMQWTIWERGAERCETRPLPRAHPPGGLFQERPDAKKRRQAQAVAQEAKARQGETADFRELVAG